MATKKQKDKEFEEKVEKIVEKKVTEFFADLPAKAGKRGKTKKSSNASGGKIVGEFIGYGIFLILLFYVFPRLPFITEDYEIWKPIAFWATTLGTFLNILKHSTGINTLARLFEIGNLVASIYSTLWLININPFDFSMIGHPTINTYFVYALYLAIVLMGIGIFAKAIRIFVPKEES